MSDQSTAPKGRNVTLREVADVLRKADSLVVASHLRPDGDALGSTLGLVAVLKALGKKVSAYNSTEVHDRWAFLPGIDEVRNRLPDWQPDITVCVDCGSLRRVADDFKPSGLVINIDHHMTNDRYGDLNHIDVEACAVGEQVYNLSRELNVPITRDMANALYLSIMTDTGSFRYSNASPRAFEIASALLRAGADAPTLAQNVYESRLRGEIALTALVYTRLTFEFDGMLVWSELRCADYAANGGYDSEPEGLASDIRGIVGVQVSCLMHEMDDNMFRAGFRGKGEIDCSAIARELGGGGHFNASGAVLRGVTYEEGKAKVLSTVRRHVGEFVKVRQAAV